MMLPRKLTHSHTHGECSRVVFVQDGRKTLLRERESDEERREREREWRERR